MNRGRKRRGGCLISFILILLILALAGYGWYLYSSGKNEAFNQKIGHRIEKERPADAEPIPENELGWYFGQLDQEGQTYYQVFYDAVLAGGDSFETACTDPDQIQTVWNAMMMDHPEFFWLTGGINLTTYQPALGEPYTVITPQRSCTPEDQVKREKEIEKAVQDYLAGVETGADEYTRIKQAYEYIIDTTDYDEYASDNQNIYSVFAGHRSVCAGYAKAFQYLMKSQDIYCIYATGTINQTGEGHGWNIVRCNGRYYHVDVTWGDPVYNETEDPVPESMRNMNYDYLCCSDSVIVKTHTIDGKMKVPACSDDDLNYYLLHDMYYTDYDKGFFRQIIYDDVDEQKASSVFCFADHDLYKEAQEDLTDSLLHDGANRILANTGLSNIKTYYEERPEINKIIIYWQYE
ncbi:MAG: hypothetical protein IIY86_01475 [Lachnospiraceae bacterium]|nr:hypothetical protein [Lachnospiraceae bacterium]